MTLIWLILYVVTLFKLSMDDLKGHQVYQSDLIVLCVLGLLRFEEKRLFQWLIMICLLFGTGLFGHLRYALGSGDLPVILSMGLTLNLIEWLNALSTAALMALCVVWIQKKAASDEVPFVPYLSVGWMVIYLIRLRLIFS